MVYGLWLDVNWCSGWERGLCGNWIGWWEWEINIFIGVVFFVDDVMVCYLVGDVLV